MLSSCCKSEFLGQLLRHEYLNMNTQCFKCNSLSNLKQQDVTIHSPYAPEPLFKTIYVCEGCGFWKCPQCDDVMEDVISLKNEVLCGECYADDMVR